MSVSSGQSYERAVKEKRVSWQEGSTVEDDEYPGRLFDSAADADRFVQYELDHDESSGEASSFAQEGRDALSIPLEPSSEPPASIARSSLTRNATRPRSFASMLCVALLVACAGAGITCGLYFGINNGSNSSSSADVVASPDSPSPPFNSAAPNMSSPQTTPTVAPAGSTDKGPNPTAPYSPTTAMPTTTSSIATIEPTTPAPSTPPPSTSPAPTRLPYVPGDPCLNATWSLLGRFRGQDAPGSLSGTAVALSANGQRLAISTPNDATAIPVNSGSVRIYDHYNKRRWVSRGTINGENVNDASGQSLSFSYDGSLLAIGSPLHSSSNYTNAGQVRVLRYANATTWSQVGSTLTDPIARPDKSFGASVALSGDGSIVACGSGSTDGTSTTATSVSVFQYNGVDWKLNGKVIEQAGGGSPVALSYDGFILAVGAPNYNGTGAVFIYHYNVTQNNWMSFGNRLVGDEQDGQFGYGLDLSVDGRVVAVGTYQSSLHGKGAGKVQVFQFQNDSWVQMGTDILGKRPRQGLGSVVSLSRDGKRVAISSLTQPAVVYRWIDERQDWYQVAQVIRSGVTAIQSAYETLGFAMDLSQDGSVLVVGDPQFQTIGDVRAYELANCTINATRNRT